MVPEQGRDYDKLFAMADSALYTVKQNGKHGYHIYSPFAEEAGADETDPAQRLERIIRIMEERNNTDGPLVLGRDSFSLIYRFILRSYRRYGGTAALILFTLKADGYDNSALTDISLRFAELLKKILYTSDIMMQNGQDSFLVLLTGRTRTGTEDELNRIPNAWEENENKDNVVIDHVIKYMDHIGGSMA